MAEQTIIIDIKVEDVKKKLADTAAAIADIKDKNKELKKANQEGKISFEDYTAAITQYNAELKLLQGTQKAAEGQYANLIKVGYEYGNSIHEQRAQLSALLKQYDSLSPEFQKSDRGAKELKSRIDELTKSITTSEQETGRFQRHKCISGEYYCQRPSNIVFRSF